MGLIVEKFSASLILKVHVWNTFQSKFIDWRSLGGASLRLNLNLSSASALTLTLGLRYCCCTLDRRGAFHHCASIPKGHLSTWPYTASLYPHHDAGNLLSLRGCSLLSNTEACYEATQMFKFQPTNTQLFKAIAKLRWLRNQ